MGEQHTHEDNSRVENGLNIHISGDRVLALFSELTTIKLSQSAMQHDLELIRKEMKDSFPCEERLVILNALQKDLDVLKRRSNMVTTAISKAFLLIYGVITASLTLLGKEIGMKIWGLINRYL